MKLICGLGNPGAQYRRTRHNVGFMVVDALAEAAGLSWREKAYPAQVAEQGGGADKLVLLKSMTFMNDSGQAVVSATAFWKLAAPDILVVHDDLDLPFGEIRLRRQGSSGGHHGVESLLERLGTDAFARLKFGIHSPAETNARDFVLEEFFGDEAARLPGLIRRAADAAKCWVELGIAAAMQRYHAPEPREPQQ